MFSAALWIVTKESHSGDQRWQSYDNVSCGEEIGSNYCSIVCIWPLFHVEFMKTVRTRSRKRIRNSNQALDEM